MPPKRRQAKATPTQELAPLPEPIPEPVPVPVPVPEPVSVVEQEPEVVAPVVAPVPVPEVKKKGKKQPKIVAVVTPDGIQGSFQSEPRRPLIAHLQVNVSSVQFYDGPLQYDPNPPTQPEPYEPGFDSYFTNQNEELLEQKAKLSQLSTTAKDDTASASASKSVSTSSSVASTTPSTAVVSTSTSTSTSTSLAPVDVSSGLPAFITHELMVEFREPSQQKKLPEKTDIACFWCTHTFDGQPCILPEREEGGVYKVYGNFCCPECALAYLLEESLDATTRWERMALLHRLYAPALGHKRIFPSPARSTLKVFGGPMSISTYRKTIRDGKVRIDIQMPPMVSILGSLDTKPIDFYDSSLRNTFSPLLQETVPKAEETLRLKRTKPLKDRESTLDSVMNIQIKVKRVSGSAI